MCDLYNLESHMNTMNLIGNGVIIRNVPISEDEFSHSVKITLHHYINNRLEIAEWLQTHIGERDKLWCWLKSLVIRFKDESDAMMFSMTWSGE